jgi:TM2 domain-containing membrane protein YozV
MEGFKLHSMFSSGVRRHVGCLRLTGTLWFFTGGLFLIGWLVDFFLIPSMDRTADRRFVAGPINFSVAWLLLTFLGIFGRSPQPKRQTALL